MSRTNHHTRYGRKDNLSETYQSLINWGWAKDKGGYLEQTDYLGAETWDLRFYAGCKRVPQVIHKVVITQGRGYYCHRLWLEPGVVKRHGKLAQRKFRARERRYLTDARNLWNAGEDVDELTELSTKPDDLQWHIW